MFGWLSSSCADTRVRPKLSLATALRLLQSLHTASDLTEKLGEPDGQGSFDHDNPASTSYLNRQSLGFWKQQVVATPEKLIDTLSIGTKMLTYNFINGPAMLNATCGPLSVCVDDSGRIIGWFYSIVLRGYEEQSWRV